MARKTTYNNITTPELISKVNPENLKLWNDFEKYLQSVQRSENTIKSYKNDIEIFFVWNLLNNNNKFFIELSKRDLISYQNWLLNENKNSPARIRRLKSALSSMSNYIEAILDDEFEGFRPIIKKVESPINQSTREKTVLEDSQLQYLLNYLVEKKHYQRAAILSLAMCSGSRKSELTRFKTSYFKDENIIYGSLYKTDEKVKTKGRGLGKYIYRYVLASQFKPYLDLWIKQREELKIDNEFLFVAKNKSGEWEQMKATTLNSYANTFSSVLGLDFYWHSLRHFFTTALSRLNIPDSVIQEIVGWDSLDMVKLYKDIDADEQLGKYFDENGVKTVKTSKLSDL